jgi:hypothetical protein
MYIMMWRHRPVIQVFTINRLIQACHWKRYVLLRDGTLSQLVFSVHCVRLLRTLKNMTALSIRI